MEYSQTVGHMGRHAWCSPIKGKLATEEEHSKGKKDHCHDEIIPKFRWNKKKGVREKSKKHSRLFVCHGC